MANSVLKTNPRLNLIASSTAHEIYLNMILLRIFKESDKDLSKTPGKKVTRTCQDRVKILVDFFKDLLRNLRRIIFESLNFLNKFISFKINPSHNKKNKN